MSAFFENAGECAHGSDVIGKVSLRGLIPANAAGLEGTRDAAAAATAGEYRFKRAFDLITATLLIVTAAPLMLVIVLMIWAIDGRPVIFRHARIGRGGRVFDCFKFRTMVRDADAALARLLAASPEARAEWEATRKLRTDPRILPVIGAFLRKTSLDELPQLFNVLRGEMSLVGPRPVVRDELVHYGARLPLYYAVRPGLTGPWQISGRSDVTYATRVRLDAAYARRPRFRRDLAILLRTTIVVFARRGAY